MRYTDTGEVHKDFHLATNATIDFVLAEYGIEFLKELFGRTAKNVYKDLYENLQKGDYQPLLEHWKYYYAREQGVFTVEEGSGDEGFSFHVTECPACRHLKEKNTPITDNFYLQISLLNEAWADKTPFTIETQIILEGEYKMLIRRRQDDSQ